MCTDEIAARRWRTIAVNKASSIEVIKMIEDSSEPIHLWARWWGTLVYVRGSEGKRLSAFIYMCALMCHRCRTSCEMGLAWRRPPRCGAMPTGGPCLFTAHLNRQPNIYLHPPLHTLCVLIWPSSEQSEHFLIAKLSVILSVADVFFPSKMRTWSIRVSWMEVPWHSTDLIKLDFNRIVSSARYIRFNYGEGRWWWRLSCACVLSFLLRFVPYVFLTQRLNHTLYFKCKKSEPQWPCWLHITTLQHIKCTSKAT